MRHEGARRVVGQDAAGPHDHDPVGQQHGLLHVVGHHDGGEAEPLVQLPIGRAERVAGHRIERPERLIHQHDPGAGGDRARHAHALGLPADSASGNRAS